MKLNQLRVAAFEFAREGMTITDPSKPDNPIVDINPAFEVLTGYTREEVVGKNCRFLQGKETKQPELEVLREAIAERQHCRVVIKNFRKDGTMFWNELSVSPILDDEGNLLGFMGVQRDATARVTLERQSMDEHEQLRKANEALMVQLQQRKSLDDRINDVIEQAMRYTGDAQ